MAHLPDAPLPHPLAALPGTCDSTPADIGAGMLSEIHEFAVPAFAVAALERLYGSMYASLRHLQLCEATRPLPHTWIGYRRGEIMGVLLFRMRGVQAIVLTEMFALTTDVAEEFCRALFSRFAYARSVCLNAVMLPAPLSRLAALQAAFSENYVIALPAEVDAYFAALGKSTRKTLRGYSNRLQRELPGLRWEVRPASALRADELRRLLRQLQTFKRDSLAARGKRAELSRRDAARLLALVSERGLVGIATVDGRIRAGALSCRFGDNYVMLLAAADPALESYRVGMLCCYWAICDCIRAGARECHLLWGRYQYKRQLLGVPQPLHRVLVFRSPLQMALSPAAMLAMAWLRLRYRLRDVLLGDPHRGPGTLQRAALAVAGVWHAGCKALRRARR